MPIGPSGERLPYPGENGSRVDQAMAMSGRPRGGPPVGNPMGANPEVLTQRLMEIAKEAEMIIGQLEAMGVNPEQLLAGGGQNAVPAAPTPPMPQMPAGVNTGGLGGNISPGLLA